MQSHAASTPTTGYGSEPMAEANHTLHLAQLRTRLHCATITLARQAALKATKRRLQAQGLKVSHYPLRDLRVRAEQYLADHREELIADASLVVEPWRQEGFFGRRAALLSPEQSAKG
jgi:hypothetical protein